MEQFSTIQEFFEFDEEDEERLAALRSVVEPHLPEIVEEFYEALDSNSRTRAVFEDEAQMERLRESLHAWLLEAFEGNYGNGYARKQRRIGEVHQDVGVDPEYVFGAMNAIRNRLMEILLEADLEIPRHEAMTSVQRMLDMNMTLILDSYWEALLEEKDALGTELASFMAHEIRNPLNAVELNMTLLQRRLSETFDDPDEYLPMLEAVRGELDRIEKLTQEIKEFTQPISVAKSWHDLESLVDELESSHSTLFSAAEIEFETEVGGEARIYCDADRIKQVLVNLLKNSVEAIDGAGEVVLSGESNDDHVTLRVADTGEGLEPESKQRVFELFYTTKASGTGLGLPIAKKVVDGHGGTIEVRANEPKGTVVEVVLPMPEDADADSRSNASTN